MVSVAVTAIRAIATPQEIRFFIILIRPFAAGRNGRHSKTPPQSGTALFLRRGFAVGRRG